MEHLALAVGERLNVVFILSHMSRNVYQAL
jgi:hypothetical protein